jgi:hypothetical protein
VTRPRELAAPAGLLDRDTGPVLRRHVEIQPGQTVVSSGPYEERALLTLLPGYADYIHGKRRLVPFVW